MALVRFVGAIGDQIDAELALGRLDRGVDLAGRNVEPLGIELEMMNERFHGALHLCALGGNDLVVVDRHRPAPFIRAQLLQALFHDADGLAHLFHADAVAVVIVAVLADRNVEIELGVALIGLRFTQIPRRTRSAHHHAGKTPRPGVSERDHADVDVALLEDAVAGQQIFEIVADLDERVAERPDVVDELRRQILVHAADAEVGRVHAAAGCTLVEHHELFAFLKTP